MAERLQIGYLAFFLLFFQKVSSKKEFCKKKYGTENEKTDAEWLSAAIFVLRGKTGGGWCVRVRERGC